MAKETMVVDGRLVVFLWGVQGFKPHRGNWGETSVLHRV